jgi:hypothetical protein
MTRARAKRLAVSAVLVAGLSVAPSTRSLAQGTPSTGGASNVDEAKRYFEQGEALRAAGQYQAALEAYLKSRALVPRATNTINAAVCLYNLGRYDEALELYEEAFTKYPEDQLAPEVRKSAKDTMATIELKVGRIAVSANVAGTLVIDGVKRGTLPQTAPVRVMPGQRKVRILYEGYEPFEQLVNVNAGATVVIDASLKALAAAGRLRVEAESLEGATLTIDGVAIGTLPWEGTLAPGPHVYEVQKGDLGTGPKQTLVVQGQTILVRAEGKPLGPEVRIVVEPATAMLSIDGAEVGRGRWQGRLPLGAHSIAVREDGYVGRTVPLAMTPTSSGESKLVLAVDPTHPRWGVAKKGSFFIEAFGGFAVAASLRSGAESSPNLGRNPNDGSIAVGTSSLMASDSGAAIGGMFGLRAGYESPIRLSFVVAAGYLALHERVSRRIHDQYGIFDVTLTQEDNLRMSGPFVAGGLGYRWPLSAAFDLGGYVMMGAAFVGSRDQITGTATAADVTRGYFVTGSGASVRSTALFAMPEVYVALREGAWKVAVGLAVPIVLNGGKPLPTGETTVDSSSKDCTAHPKGPDCGTARYLVAQESAFGQFVLWVPRVSVGYSF